MSKKFLPETYVGDNFTLAFLRGDQDPLRRYDGYQCKLIGFTHKVIPVLRHQTNQYAKQPGLYQVLGDPVVKLETDLVVKLPLLNLSPIGYAFEDRIEKNLNYQRELKKYRFINELPDIRYNIGDKVLIAKHGQLYDDLVSHVVDIVILPNGIRYVVYQNDDLKEIPQDKIIDVLELGDYSEHERIMRQTKSLEKILQRRCPRYRYDDMDYFD